MGKVWDEFLHGSVADGIAANGSPATCGHAVEIYSRLEELGDTVTEFLAAGFELGEPALVLARREHFKLFATRLAARGWDAALQQQEGLLVVADTATIRHAVFDSDLPFAEAFEQVIGELLDRTAAHACGRDVRVFGELVDVLYRDGQPETAIAVEELWNHLARSRRFSLLCGYELDVFDPEAQAGTLGEICRVHSHVLPAHDADGLARAVRLALDEELGQAKAADVYYVVGNRFRDERLPIAQRVLMWVAANRPDAADRVLAKARAHYGAATAVPDTAGV
ncbi:MAG TPA: MEDS domain-containing protein [Gaiellaceae bacterium]